MISVITMQSGGGDCPSNITIDVDILRNLTTEQCRKYVDKEYGHRSDKDRAELADEYMEDAKKYVTVIDGEDDYTYPDSWSVLAIAEVELPQMVDHTDVIFYGV